MATRELRIDLGGAATTTALVYAAAASDAELQPASAALILAHGAGAGQRHPFIVGFADALAHRGLDVVTFNFRYMEAHRRVPDRAPVLEACYGAVIERVHADVASARRPLFIGGKSMGGRMATQLAAANAGIPVRGLVLLGYPLHPPGRPDKPRDAHLPRVGRPMLFVQGSRDTFGTPSELAPVLASIAQTTLHIVEGGDHSFALPKKNPDAQRNVYTAVQDAVVSWMATITKSGARTPRRSA